MCLESGRCGIRTLCVHSAETVRETVEGTRDRRLECKEINMNTKNNNMDNNKDKNKVTNTNITKGKYLRYLPYEERVRVYMPALHRIFPEQSWLE